MSIASMTEVAFQSRSDVGDPKFVPKTYAELAGAAGGKNEPATSVDTALKTVTTYVPTEILTLYVAVLSQMKNVAKTGSPDAFWVFLGLTPVVVWLVYAAKVKSTGKPFPHAPRSWPLWEMAAGTIGYSAWAIALPNAPFESLQTTGLASIIVLITSSLLGLAAPLFSRKLS
jgi:hypothetical protein